jgi:hypothetical protein
MRCRNGPGPSVVRSVDGEPDRADPPARRLSGARRGCCGGCSAAYCQSRGGWPCGWSSRSGGGGRPPLGGAQEEVVIALLPRSPQVLDASTDVLRCLPRFRDRDEDYVRRSAHGRIVLTPVLARRLRGSLGGPPRRRRGCRRGRHGPAFTTAVADRARVVYQVLNPPYHRWPQEFPPLQAGAHRAAASARPVGPDCPLDPGDAVLVRRAVHDGKREDHRLAGAGGDASRGGARAHRRLTAVVAQTHAVRSMGPSEFCVKNGWP